MAPRLRILAALFGILGIALLGKLYLMLRDFDQQSTYKSAHARPIELVRPFSIPVMDFRGQFIAKLTERSIIGTPTLLHFWATWCASCREEILRVEAFSDSIRSRGINTYGILTSDAPTNILKSGLLGGRHFKNGIDELGDIAALYQVQALPYTMLIDAKGQILYRSPGVLNRGSELEMLKMIETMDGRLAKTGLGVISSNR